MKTILIIIVLTLSLFLFSCSDEKTTNISCQRSDDCNDGLICSRDNTCKEQICAFGERICISENSYQQCSLDGTYLSDEITCPTNKLCNDGFCVDTSCNTDDFKCIDTDATSSTYKECTINGFWSEVKTCPENETCLSELKACGVKTCQANEIRCLDTNGVQEQRCNNTGTAWLDPATCLGDNPSCTLSNGCIEGDCVPNEIQCVNESSFKKCKADGSAWIQETTNCAEGTVCSENQCITQTTCTENQRRCSSSTSYQICNTNGIGYSESINCETSTVSGELKQCYNGACKDECELASEKRSYMGCEYYAIDLDNTSGIFRNDEDDTPHYYSIIVSNPSANTASVTITDDNGFEVTRDVLSNDIEIFEVGDLHYLGTVTSNGKTYHQWGDNHQIIDTARGTRYSYKITSNLPIIAYQFSPLGGSTNYSNDASMLIPIAAYDKEYRMISWEHWEDNSQTMTIIAKEDNTSVDINFTTGTKEGNMIPAQSANSNYNVVLSKGETIQFASQSGDLSGSYINADKEIGVFGGHSCTYIPNNKSACDHIEEQLFPLNTWGSHYIVIKTKTRGSETEYYKIITSEPETVLNFNPGIDVGLASPLTRTTVHAAGETKIFSTKDSFELTTSKPVSIGQFITSQQDVSLLNGIGDPAFILQVPVEQYRDSYLFLVPNTYAENYVTIVATPTYDGLVPTITLDGNIISANSFTSIGNYYFHIKSLTSGTHSIVSDFPIGISVYGYDNYVSYGYPGGLDLRNIKGFQ